MLGKSRATICISAHYVPARIQFLASVLDAIAAWPVKAADVIIVSNAPEIMNEEPILTMTKLFADKFWTLQLEVTGLLDHPYELTWSHKYLIPRWLSHATDKDEFFIYLEDDIVFTTEKS